MKLSHHRREYRNWLRRQARKDLRSAAKDQILAANYAKHARALRDANYYEASQVAVWQNIAANTYRYARNAVVRAQRLFAEANEIDLKG